MRYHIYLGCGVFLKGCLHVRIVCHGVHVVVLRGGSVHGGPVLPSHHAGPTQVVRLGSRLCASIYLRSPSKRLSALLPLFILLWSEKGTERGSACL